MKTHIIKFYFIFIEKIIVLLLNRNTKITHNNVNLEFYSPNFLCYYRSNTFSTKEPETLEWIDSFEKDSVFWDIGANVGLYSIYAAKKNSMVYAFEPSFFNLEILVRNINQNNLMSKIHVLPIALSDKSILSEFRLTSIQWGGALSTFDKKYGYDGNNLNQIFSYLTIGFKADELLKILNLPNPDYIKLDVDGIEHLILSGAYSTLSKVKSILIEISSGFHEQRDFCNNLLRKLGFNNVRNGEISGPAGTINQIWERK